MTPNLTDALESAKVALKASPLDDQYAFANQIASFVRDNQALVSQAAKSAFGLRQVVVFRGRAGERLVGIITKLNPTRALVQVKDTTFSVPYSSLRPWSTQDAAEVSQRLSGMGSQHP